MRWSGTPSAGIRGTAPSHVEDGVGGWAEGVCSPYLRRRWSWSDGVLSLPLGRGPLECGQGGEATCVRGVCRREVRQVKQTYDVEV